MGSYLGRSRPQPSSPAQALTSLPEVPVNRRQAQPLHQVHRVQHIHRAHPAPRHRPARRPPNWDPADPTARVVNEAWRRFPMRRPPNSIMGPLPSDWWESYLKRCIWSLRHPRATWSPVTIKIAPPERRAPVSTPPAEVINSAEASSRVGKASDPCAKETVLRAIRQSTKARARLEEPLSPHSLDSKRRNSETRSSAFEPLMKNGIRTSFVPRSGPLKGGFHSRKSDHSLNKGPGGSSRSSLAGTHAGGPRSSQRNAITSSYSSSRNFSGVWKRSASSASFHTPEWPVKKKGKAHQTCSPAPLVSGAGRSGQPNQPVPLLQASPQNLLARTPALRLGHVLPEEDLALGKKVRLIPSDKCSKDRTEPTTDSGPETPCAFQPILSLSLPAQDSHPQPESLKKMQASSGSLADPQPTAEASSVVGSPLNTPSLLAPLGCSQSESPPSTSSGLKAEAFTLPASSASPVADTTRPPPTLPTGRSPPPQQQPTITPAGPSHLLGTMSSSSPTPHLPASTSPAAASTDPISNPTVGLPPDSDVGGGVSSRISVTATASSASGTLMPTFKPIFGSIGPLKTSPMVLPFSFEQMSPPATPASTRPFHNLVKATSIVMATPPAHTCKDTASRTPLSLGVVNATQALSDTSAIPSTCHTFLLGAARAFKAHFSPTSGFMYPPHNCPSIPAVHTVTVFRQVLPGAGQTPPDRSTANFRGVNNPSPLVSALVTPSQPSLSCSNSKLTPAFTVSPGEISRSPFSLPPAAILQSAFGGADGLKQGLSQLPVGLSFNNPLIFGNSAIAPPTPASTPTQPSFSSPTQSVPGGRTPPASIFHSPAGIGQDMGGSPADFPLGQASATGFQVATQTQGSGVCSSVFGSMAPRPFAFGGLVTPMDCGDSGMGVAAPDMGSTPGVPSVATTFQGTPRITMPLGKAWSPNPGSLSSQSTPFTLGKASISARKNMFEGPCRATFAQSTPIHRSVRIGSSHSFGVLSPPAQGLAGRTPFKLSATSVFTGAKSKTLKNREQGHSRRHHAHKK